jgi:hypothetical protein
MSALASLPPIPSPAPVLPERTFTAAELAALFRVNRWTIYNWSRTGTIPEGRQFGRCRRWTPSDIAPLLAEREG